MVALVLVALSLGLSDFAAAIGIGMAGVHARTRVRVGLVFGIFEAGMPISFPLAAAVIGTVSVVMPLAGLGAGHENRNARRAAR